MELSLHEKLRKYILTQHKSELLNILTDSDTNKSFSVGVNFITLFEDDMIIGNGLLNEPEKYLTALNEAVLSSQKCLFDEVKEESNKEQYKIKSKVSVRIQELPVFGEATFPSNNDVGVLLKIIGTLIKASSPNLLEYQRDYICSKCHHVTTIQAEYEKYYTITAPSKCEECHSINVKPKKDIDVINFIDYQEIKVQEHFGKSKVGTVPRSIIVTLEGDLVDSCKPGDDVIVTGILMRRWRPLRADARFNIDLVLKANNLEVCNEQKSMMASKEVREAFSDFWEHYKHQELFGRNHILKSFCPQLFGLYLAKLAVLTVLAGGVKKTNETGCSSRGMSHLLFVGDAGTGKSHLLRYASKISSRSIFTTGIGSTTAGLTVTAVKENGDWNLEAGALVLADGGVCCIDDFNSIREHDRTSIHEAMEQQTISVAKAGIVTKLNTRCSVFATTSPKGKYDCTLPMTINVAISSPLLSRFDIVLVLLDSKNPHWDKSLSTFMLEEKKNIRPTPEQLLNKTASLFNYIWSTSDIQNYFSVIKEIMPTMSEEAGIILRTYYQFQRMLDSRNAARTTVRLLEGLIRLSQGHARLMFRKQVAVVDAITAISLIESSTHDGAVNDSVNVLHTVLPENPYDEYKSQLTLILSKLKLHEILEKELEKLNIMETFMSDKELSDKLEKTPTDMKTKETKLRRSNEIKIEKANDDSTLEFIRAAENDSKNYISETETDTLNGESGASKPTGDSFKRKGVNLDAFEESHEISDIFLSGFLNESNTNEEGQSNKRIKLSVVESQIFETTVDQHQDYGKNSDKKVMLPSERVQFSDNTTENLNTNLSTGNNSISESLKNVKENYEKQSPDRFIEESQKAHNLRNIFGVDDDDWSCLDI